MKASICGLVVVILLIVLPAVPTLAAAGTLAPTVAAPVATAMLLPTTAAPIATGMLIPTTTAPVAKPTLTPTATAPIATATLSPITAKPVATATLTPTATAPVAKVTLTPTAAAPIATATLSPITAEPVATATLTPTAATPISTATLTSTSGTPFATATFTPTEVAPVATATFTPTSGTPAATDRIIRDSGPQAKMVIAQGASSTLVVSAQNVSFAATQLTGGTQVITGTTTAWVVEDSTGSGAGWHLIVEASDFVSGAHTIAKSGFMMRLLADDIAVIGGNTGPSVVSPFASFTTIDTSKSFASAALNEGMGTYSLQPAFRLIVPASAYAGTYTSTITLTIVAGP